MKSFKLILHVLALALLMLVTVPPVTPLTSEEEPVTDAGDDRQESTTSLRGASRFLASNLRMVMKCDKYPRVCRAKGSPGPDCCKKRCVNVLTDRLNCGRCGKKCKYSETCCKGECVNPMNNRKHCGVCNNRCERGSSCTYGLCSYA